MAKWRPEGWEKIVDAITSKILDFEGHDGDPELVEAGADAMLDALRKKGVHADGTKAIYYDGEEGPGTLVFIPDEEV